MQRKKVFRTHQFDMNGMPMSELRELVKGGGLDGIEIDPEGSLDDCFTGEPERLLEMLERVEKKHGGLKKK